MFAHSFSIFNNRLLQEALASGDTRSWMSVLVVALYGAVLIALSFYGGHRYLILLNYFKGRRNQPQPLRRFAEDELPGITIQLPIFNEKYVVDELLDAVCQIDYPRDRLEIQVLDDSTDETTRIAQAAIARWRKVGLDLRFIHRGDRSGYKAGALAEAMPKAKYDLMAIFDADFRPQASFLRELVDHFSDPKVGVAQARWGHANRRHSLLTRVQAMMLDGHFILEHTARNRTGLFFNFNGTAGIWRRQAIIDGGGWQSDTLTEDLDLSYRSQMEGWRFVYDPQVVCPAELPVEMNAFKSQQHRWAKGSVQVMLKLLPDVWRAKLPFRQKMEAFYHLTGNLAFPLMLLMSLLTYPMLAMRARIADGDVGLILDSAIFLCATASVIFFYCGAQLVGYRDGWRRCLILPMMLSVGIGIVVNQARAVVEALVGHQSEFVRTPKYNIDAKEALKARSYRGVRNLVPFVELSLAIYFTLVVGFAIQEGLWTTMPFLLLFFTGFWYVSLQSLFQGRLGQKQSAGKTAPPLAPAEA